MRIFSLPTDAGRKVVLIEIHGSRMSVTHRKPDGSTKRSEKEHASPAEARLASDVVARELVARGFVEQPSPDRAAPARSGSGIRRPVAAPQPAARVPAVEEVNPDYLIAEEDEAAPAAPIARLAPLPAAAATEPKPKKKKKGKKRRQKGEPGDGLDKRVLAAAGAFGIGLVGLVGFLLYDAFLRPASIVGSWKGSRVDYEAGGPMTYVKYHYVFDDQGRASMSILGGDPTIGTYTLKGDRLTLKFGGEDDARPKPKPQPKAKGEGQGDDDEGADDEGGGGGGGGGGEVTYKVVLGHGTLELYDPATGKKKVDLVRMLDKPRVGGGPAKPEPPKDVAAPADGPADKAADAKLASVQFSPKDGAFKVRHPRGWEVETGSRPDNTYSWARFTKGSAKIQVFADVAGSLMSGSDSDHGNHEPGSEFAPVHRAHELYQKTISEEYSSYNEGKPGLFQGAELGEGRIAALTASEGLLGSKLKGYRITLLSNDRRITVLCTAPAAEFDKLKPTFLAVARSVSR